jgi:hypothetical protein
MFHQNIGTDQQKHWYRPTKTLVPTNQNIGTDQPKHWYRPTKTLAPTNQNIGTDQPKQWYRPTKTQTSLNLHGFHLQVNDVKTVSYTFNSLSFTKTPSF